MYFLTPLLPSCFLYWHIDGGGGGVASAVVDGVDTEKYATEELFRWADIINCNLINYVHTMYSITGFCQQMNFCGPFMLELTVVICLYNTDW